jgi:hypothetical protein
MTKSAGGLILNTELPLPDPIGHSWDPLGSGTTGEAAKRAGVDFIGFEKDATYYEIAKGKLDAC